MFTRAIEPAGVPVFWSGSVPDQLSVKTPLLLYEDVARTCVTGGCRSGTLVLASMAMLLLLSTLPAASLGDAVEGIEVAVLPGEEKVTVPDASGVVRVWVWHRMKGPLLTE